MASSLPTSDWMTEETRAALVLVLRRERSGKAGDQELTTVFERVGAEAVAQARPPEDVLDVFRHAWDDLVSPLRGEERRGRLYYFTLSKCLDSYLACAEETAEMTHVPPESSNTFPPHG